MTAQGFTNQGNITPDNLVSGEFPCIQRLKTISGGEKLKRGAVLGKITADGTYKLSTTAATDGSQRPVAILAEDIDVSTANKQATIFLAGEFNTNALTFGTGHTETTVIKSFEDNGPYTIFLRKNQEV